MTKIPKIVYLILIIAGVAIGLVIFLQTKLPAQQESQSPTQVSPQPSPSTATQSATSTQSQIDTSDWNIYFNERYRLFKFKYPSPYKIGEDYSPRLPIEGVIQIGKNVSLTFDNGPLHRETIEEQANYESVVLFGREAIKGKEILYVGREKAIKVKIVDKRGVYREEIYFRHGNRENLWHYCFEFYEDKEGLPKDVFDAIVSSFEFMY